MLQQIMEHLHNYFIRESVPGSYEITGGMISPIPYLKDGQRFLIAGSDLNDGVYTWHNGIICNADDTAAVGLHDEMFAGTICALAVPPSVIALSEEINTWVAKYAETVSSPFQSESFGGYSYTKAQSGDSGNPSMSWEQVFRDRLNRWRRVAF